MKNKSSVIYISHGGGPLPLLGDDGHKEMIETLIAIKAKIRKPSVILVISAHWEEKKPTITAGKSPSLIYDYYGFPEESYSITYPSPGYPLLAKELAGALEGQGINAALDALRGIDHGVYVPLKIMYPEADIPCVQLSLVRGLDPLEHIKIGAALTGAIREDVLIIGSGFSFHNIHEFYLPVTSDSKHMNESFERWLIDTCSSSTIDEEGRAQRLVNWEHVPFARYCHPREEHLLPLHVCYGMAQTKCSEHFELTIMNKKSSMYIW